MPQLHFLIEECLSPKLVEQANGRGIPADHTERLGLAGKKDLQIARFMFVESKVDYTLVTNNRPDFLKIHGGQGIHPGLVVIVPNVEREGQLRLFSRVLDHLAADPDLDLTNMVLEIQADGTITLEVLSA